MLALRFCLSLVSADWVDETHRRLSEPSLRFGPQDEGAIGPHPLNGILEYGPFGKHRLAGVPNPIRIAFVGQKSMIARLHKLLRELDGRHSPKDRKAYLPDYPGFSHAFETTLAYAGDAVSIELPDSLDHELEAAAAPHRVLSEALTGSIASLRNQRHAFDIVLVGLDEKWASGFSNTGDEDFDLHDFLKGYGASAGIPIQVIRSGSANNPIQTLIGS